MPRRHRVFQRNLWAWMVVLGLASLQSRSWADTDNPILPGWPVFVDGSPYDPVVGDVTGDGQPEVIVTTLTRQGEPVQLYVFAANGEPLPGWPVLLASDDGASIVTVKNVDEDPAGEICVVTGSVAYGGSEDAKIYVLKGDGSVLNGWPVAIEGKGGEPPAIGDLDGDGVPDIVVASESWPPLGQAPEGYVWSRLYALRPDGTLLSGWPIELDQQIVYQPSAPVLADIDDDGMLETLLNVGNNLYAWRWTGEVVAGWPQLVKTHQPSVGDVDGDHQLDVISFPYAYHADGTVVEGWPVEWSGYSAWNVVGDLDGEGGLEVLSWEGELLCGYPAVGRLVLRDGSGNIKPGWPQPMADGLGQPDGIVLANLDDDPLPEAMVVAAPLLDCDYGYPRFGPEDLYAWNGDGTMVASWSSKAGQWGGGGYTRAAIAEIDGNRKIEVITNSLYLPDLNTGIVIWISRGMSRRLYFPEWPQFQHDPRHTGQYRSRSPTSTE